MPAISETAFLFLDLQTDIVALSNTQHAETITGVADRVKQLADQLDIPTFQSVVAFGNPLPKPIAPLLQGAPSKIVTRAGPKLFSHAHSAAEIRSLARPTLALAGVLTEVVVLHAALGAIDQGFSVHILLDLCGGHQVRTEQAAVLQMQSAGATISSTLSFATSLVDDFTTDEGSAVAAALQALL